MRILPGDVLKPAQLLQAGRGDGPVAGRGFVSRNQLPMVVVA
jgi:hypothetical protein